MWTINLQERNLFTVTIISFYWFVTVGKIVVNLLLRCTYLVSDLQLDVKGCRDVYASFDKYVEVERLEGENKYQAEEHGLQVGFPFEILETGTVMSKL